MARAISQFLIEWTERGGQLPANVKRELDALGRAGNQAGATLTDKLGTAFERLEKREPTIVMRQFRGAVDSLAVSALGASGPLGRLSVGVLGLIPGAFGVTAALGGAVFGIKAILAPTTAAVAALDKFSDGLKAAQTPAEQLHDLLDKLATGATKTQTILAGLQAGAGATGFGFGGVFGFLADKSLASATAARERAIESEAAARHRTATRLITDLELQTAGLGRTAGELARVQAAQLNLNATDTAALVLSATKHEAREREIRQLERLNLQITRARGAQLERRLAFEAVPGPEPGEPQFAPGTVFPQLGRDLGLIERPITGFVQALEFAGLSLHDVGNASVNVAGSLDRAARSAQQFAVGVINAGAGLIAGLVSGGSPGGFIVGAGGLLSTINPVAGAIVSGLGTILLASESNEERRHTELLKALEPVGEVLFLVANRTGDPDADDALVRRIEHATGRRVSVRFGGR